MTDVSPLIDVMGLTPHPGGSRYRRAWTAPAQVGMPCRNRHSTSATIFFLDRGEETR